MLFEYLSFIAKLLERKKNEKLSLTFQIQNIPVILKNFAKFKRRHM